MNTCIHPLAVAVPSNIYEGTDTTEPILFVNDPKLIKQITISDAQYFEARGANQRFFLVPIFVTSLSSSARFGTGVGAMQPTLFFLSFLRNFVATCIRFYNRYNLTNVARFLNI